MTLAKDYSSNVINISNWIDSNENTGKDATAEDIIDIEIKLTKQNAII